MRLENYKDDLNERLGDPESILRTEVFRRTKARHASLCLAGKEALRRGRNLRR